METDIDLGFNNIDPASHVLHHLKKIDLHELDLDLYHHHLLTSVRQLLQLHCQLPPNNDNTTLDKPSTSRPTDTGRYLDLDLRCLKISFNVIIWVQLPSVKIT